MDQFNIFISVGGTASAKQEAFVRAVEDRLRSEGLVPHTVGRNTFSADAPLETITELMDSCIGTVVIALERTYYPSGFDKPGGPNQAALSDVRLPTPWNQIEAAMAFSRGHPMMVIMEKGLKSEGLLERGHKWYVQWVAVDAASLSTVEFNGVFGSWKSKVMIQHASQKNEAEKSKPKVNPTDLTVGDLLRGLKPAQLWSILAALAAMVAGAFVLGAKLLGTP